MIYFGMGKFLCQEENGGSCQIFINSPPLLWMLSILILYQTLPFLVKCHISTTSPRSRPQKEKRIEAHIFVAFLAYALHVTLRRRLRDLAPGLTPRSVLEKFRSLQMIDVHLPTTDGRKVIMSRYTQPEPDLQMLIEQLRLSLPNQPRPRVTAEGQLPEHFL
jgi:hypothetical protein